MNIFSLSFFKKQSERESNCGKKVWSWAFVMATGRGGKSLIGPLLAVNFVVYLILLGLAGWSLDKYIDGEQDHPRQFSLFIFCFINLSKYGVADFVVWHVLHVLESIDLGGNPSTTFLLTFALIGGLIGACSLFAGLLHLRAWHSSTLDSASSSAFISWAITALTFGYLFLTHFLFCFQNLKGEKSSISVSKWLLLLKVTFTASIKPWSSYTIPFPIGGLLLTYFHELDPSPHFGEIMWKVSFVWLLVQSGMQTDHPGRTQRETIGKEKSLWTPLLLSYSNFHHWWQILVYSIFYDCSKHWKLLSQFQHWVSCYTYCYCMPARSTVGTDPPIRTVQLNMVPSIGLLLKTSERALQLFKSN